MPVKPLPSRPNLAHLKQQAKDLLKDHAARALSCAQRLREFHPKFRTASDEAIFRANLHLNDAQLAIARERGFASWTRLKRHIEKPTQADRLDVPHHERIEDPVFRHAVDLIDAGEVTALRGLLAADPQLVHKRVVFEGGNYFRNPTLLEFIAENPIRRGILPSNIVEIARVILDAGTEVAAVNSTLGLVATGRVPREQRLQTALVAVLCAYGADPNSAIRAAAGHGEFQAVEALIQQGAKVDLPVAAALAQTNEFLKLLPNSSREDKHLSLAFSSQHGHIDIVRALLDDGEDVNRFNPPGAHSHSTPLHQAALHGDMELVKLLVERGARLDVKDLIWQGTPADWAEYEGKPEVAAYLRQQQERKS